MKLASILLVSSLLCVGALPLHAASTKQKKPKTAYVNPLEKERDEALKKATAKAKADARSIRKAMANITPVPTPCVSDVDDPSELRQAADSGDVQAMIQLGNYYMSHPTAELENETTAGEYFRKAAETGDPDAKAWLVLYNCSILNGITMDVIQERMYNDCIEAAQKGSLLAAYMAGVAISPKTPEQWTEKLSLLKKAAHKGFVPAMRAYGEALTKHLRKENKGLLYTAPILDDAKVWLELAAKEGDLTATYALADLESIVPHTDIQKAEKIYRKLLPKVLASKWRWFDGLLSRSNYVMERGYRGGERMRMLMDIYGNLNRAYPTDSHEVQTLRKELVDTLKKLASEGDVEAMAAIVNLDRRWQIIIRGAKLPAPVKDSDYLPILEKRAEEGDTQAFILLRVCRGVRRPD